MFQQHASQLGASYPKEGEDDCAEMGDTGQQHLPGPAGEGMPLGFPRGDVLALMQRH